MPCLSSALLAAGSSCRDDMHLVSVTLHSSPPPQQQPCATHLEAAAEVEADEAAGGLQALQRAVAHLAAVAHVQLLQLRQLGQLRQQLLAHVDAAAQGQAAQALEALQSAVRGQAALEPLQLLWWG